MRSPAPNTTNKRRNCSKRCEKSRAETDPARKRDISIRLHNLAELIRFDEADPHNPHTVAGERRLAMVGDDDATNDHLPDMTYGSHVS